MGAARGVAPDQHAGGTMNTKLRTLALLTSSAVALAVGAVAAPTAEAGTGDCAGNLIARKVARAGDGTAVGEVVVYYNASNGNNCARFNHIGPSYGVARETSIFIERCPTNNPGANCFLAGGPTSYDNSSYA